MNYKYFTGLFIIAGILVNCSRDRQNNMSEEEYENTKRALVGANRILVKKDRERIKSYIERRGWDMQETQTGLWYQIYDHGAGPHAITGNIISLEYHVSLLDGTVCYDSDSLGLKKFRIGQGGVESGLEEGVLLLRKGDQARFIMPPHLAHGLTGDGNAIPPRSILIYEVGVVDVDSVVNALQQ